MRPRDLSIRIVDAHSEIKSFWRDSVLVVGFVLLLSGYRKVTDVDLPQYFIDLTQGRSPPINPIEGWKFEGLLSNTLLYLYAQLGFGADVTAILLWITGIFGTAFAFYISIANGSLALKSLLYILAFSHLVDTLSMWIGKTDPLLMAFLILSANRNRAIGFTGIALAPFVHPMIAAVSTAGLISVNLYYERRFRWPEALLGLIASIVALGLFRSLFPQMAGRGGYALAQSLYISTRAAEDGLPSMVGGIIAPLLAFFTIAGLPPKREWSPTLLVVGWLAGTAVLTSCVVLDHTRDACLTTLPAMLAFLFHQRRTPEARPLAVPAIALAALFALRLIAPHYDANGPHVFRWSPIMRWGEETAERLFTDDAARCADNALTCLYHHDVPFNRRPAL